MANNIKYFIGNWKMFGTPESINILSKINKFVKSDKKFNKRYKTVITPPYTLVQTYAKFFLNKNEILLVLKIVITRIILVLTLELLAR